MRRNPDEGTVLMQDGDMNPGMPQVVAAGYENSSFNFTQPTATTLHAVDAASDPLFDADPAEQWHADEPAQAGDHVGLDAGLDVAGADSSATSTRHPSRGTELDTVDAPDRHESRSAASALASPSSSLASRPGRTEPP